MHTCVVLKIHVGKAGTYMSLWRADNLERKQSLPEQTVLLYRRYLLEKSNQSYSEWEHAFSNLKSKKIITSLICSLAETSAEILNKIINLLKLSFP